MSIRRECPAKGGDRLSSLSSALAVPIVAAGLLWPTGLGTSTTAEAKTPGKTYCFYRVCHRVMTLEETRRAIGKRTVVHASHYDDPRRDRYNPSNLTSSGEWFRAGVPDNAASPKLPNGTIIVAWNPATRQAAVLRINNAGPYWGNRTLDVSRAAAERLGFARQGVAALHTQVVYAPDEADITWRKGRRYAAVPGDIGAHGSFELALAEAGRRMGGPSMEPAPTGTAVASAETGVTGPAVVAALDAPAPEPMAMASLAGAAMSLTLPPQRVAQGRLADSPTASAISRPFEAAAVAGLRKLVNAPLALVPPQTSVSGPLASVSTGPAPTADTARPVAPVVTRAAIARTQKKALRIASIQQPARPVRASKAATAKPVARVIASRNQTVEIYDDEDDARPVRAQRRIATAAATRRTASYLSAACRADPAACEVAVPSGRSVRVVRSSSNRP